MKNIKKLIAIVLTVALCMSLGAPALAGGEPNPHGGPCYIIDEMYYPMDIDDAGEGWYYTAATRTLTVENFTCETFGLYAYYEAENLYVEMVGDNNNCIGDVRSECYPLEEDVDGGAIYFIGDGSITVAGDLRGPRYGFHSGTVTAGDISSGWGGKPIAVYDGATLNVVDSGYICSFDVYGGVINFVSQYSSRMAASDKSYLVHAGMVTVTNTSGNDALHVDEEAYAQVIGGGATFTSGDGAEVFHNTEGSINRVRLVSDPDTDLSDVVIAGSGTPVAAPARPTADTATDDEKPDASQSTDISGNQTGGIDSGNIMDFAAMATEMGLDLSTVSVEMVKAYAEELGFDLSGYSDEELSAILTELAAVQDAESGEGETSKQVSFSDVAEGAWYHDTVVAAANAGIVAGNADGTFAPNEALSWTQAVTFAVRLDQYQRGEHIYGAADQTKVWYEIYVDYALEHGIIDRVVVDVGAPITRGDAAIIFAKVLGSSQSVNVVPEGFFSDVTGGTEVYEAVHSLAAAGVVNGKPLDDGSVVFDVGGQFLRSEVATIVSRMAGLVDPVVIG